MIKITMSDKAKELEPILRRIYNDDDFVQGTIINAGNDSNIETIIEFINHAYSVGDNVTYEDIISLAFLLGEKTDNARSKKAG